MIKKFILISLLFIIFLYCSGVKSDKEVINEIILNVKNEINNGNMKILYNIIDETYKDQYNRKKAEVINIIKNYLQTYSGLKVNIEGIMININKSNLASVELSVYFTVSTSSILKKIMRKYTDKYVFLINFKKINNKWKVVYSEYEYSGV